MSHLTRKERKHTFIFFLPEGREIIVQNKTNKVLICQMNVVKLMAKKQTNKKPVRMQLPVYVSLFGRGKAVYSISHSNLYGHVVRVSRHLINVSKKG